MNLRLQLVIIIVAACLAAGAAVAYALAGRRNLADIYAVCVILFIFAARFTVQTMRNRRNK